MLKSIGAAGVIGLAGCATDEGGEGGGDGGDGGDGEELDSDGGDGTDGSDGGDGGSDGGDGDDGEGENMESEPLPMGSILPITGSLEAYGSGMQAAVDLAVQHINDAGGPLDREIDINHTDSETRPEAGVNRLQTLISDNDIVGFVGAASSGVSTPLAERVGEEEVMEVSNASTSPVLADLGYNDEDAKFFARTAPNDGQQGVVMGRILDDFIEAETASFLYVDNPYGEGLAKTASEAFSGETLNMVGYGQDAADYTSTLDQVFDGDPDGVGFVGYPGNGTTIMQQWDQGGYGGEWVLSEGVNSPEDFFQPLEDIVEGMYLASPQPEDTEGADRYAEAIGEEDTLFAPHAYDAMFLMALAMERAGEASSTAIAQNIRAVSRPEGETVTVNEFDRAKELLADGNEINYEGASSPVDLNESLEPLNRFAILQIQDAQAETLETIPRSEFEGELG
jgi:branched-chain amino acid transport system substrate-binding protein